MPHRTVHPGIGTLFLFFLILLPLGTAATQGQSKPADPVTVLEFEMPIEREIASGEKHTYRVSLSEGEFALFTIEQIGLNLEELLIDQAGKVVADADTAPRNDGVDRINMVAMTAGDHRLELRPVFRGEKGKYRVTFKERRPATERDRALFQADLIYIEFMDLNGAGKYKEALTALERVLAIREKFSEPSSGGVGIVLNRIGMVYYSLGDNLKGQEYLARTLKYYDSYPPSEPLYLANALNNSANTSYFRGDLNEAEGLYKRSLEIKEKELGPNSNSVALTLGNLGSLYRIRGDYPSADSVYLRSLEIRESALGKDHQDLRGTLFNLAAVNAARGDYNSALAYDKRMVDILTQKLGPEHPDTAAALSTLAKVYLEIGDFASAEPLLTKSLETLRKSLKEEHDSIVGGLANLAQVHQGKGDAEKARVIMKRH